MLQYFIFTVTINVVAEFKTYNSVNVTKNLVRYSFGYLDKMFILFCILYGG